MRQSSACCAEHWSASQDQSGGTPGGGDLTMPPIECRGVVGVCGGGCIVA